MPRPVILACVLALLGAPGIAAALSADAGRLQGCVQWQAGGPAQVLAACKGTVSGDCPDQTTLGITNCAMREAAAWDELLNAWWAPMRDRAKANGTWDRLLASQRQWIRDRDAECARVYEEWRDGSIRTVMAANCQLDLTAAKAVEFFFTLYR